MTTVRYMSRVGRGARYMRLCPRKRKGDGAQADTALGSEVTEVRTRREGPADWGEQSTSRYPLLDRFFKVH